MSRTDLFNQKLLAWFDKYGRNDLPWQLPRNPYRVWVSEIMLQQTQVKTVIPYFNRFMAAFPTLNDLANATEDEVLALWSGLGYYSRGRNLLKTANVILRDYQGNVPHTEEELIKLSGIGASTAAAIVTQAFDKPAAILDGNVKRVLCRYFKVEGVPQQTSTTHQLLRLANACLPSERFADYTQAIMDLGALCCKSRHPDCNICPLQTDCLAYKDDAVDGYPNKKPKKKLPIKHQQFILLKNRQQQIYLEKNPPKGLWGGLWVLPSVDLDDCPIAFINKKYALTAEKVSSLLTFKHSFSHFHLHIHAKIIEADCSDFNIHKTHGVWFSKNQLSDIGLAKPVSRILSQFFK